jgi:uncharacterized protein (DUF58 family)
MESLPPSFDPRVLADLASLQLRARRIVEGTVAGLHRSAQRGFSIEFAEHREYTAGDDPRYLDWKVHARTEKYYLKQYEDETNLVCHLVIDQSASMSYRGPQAALSKFAYAQCLAAALAWLILQQQDAVGLLVFDTQIRTQLHPSNASAQLQRLLQTLEAAQPAGPTRVGQSLRRVAEQLTKRGVVVILSDLFDDPAELLAALRLLHRRHHDLIVLQVVDPAELDFPFDRPTLFRGLEQARHMVVDPRSLRSAYLAELQQFLKRIKRACHECEIAYQLVRTDSDPAAILKHVLQRR